MLTTKVLFVCMGNICRSPSAQGVFEQHLINQGLLAQFEVDSAGTHAYHTGKPPDARSQIAAKKCKIDLSNQRARTVHESDFYHYDYIVAMDKDNFSNLKYDCPIDYQSKLSMLLSYLPNEKLTSVPDPYYEGKFDEVFALIDKSAQQLLQHILANR